MHASFNGIPDSVVIDRFEKLKIQTSSQSNTLYTQGDKTHEP